VTPNAGPRLEYEVAANILDSRMAYVPGRRRGKPPSCGGVTREHIGQTSQLQCARAGQTRIVAGADGGVCGTAGRGRFPPLRKRLKLSRSAVR